VASVASVIRTRALKLLGRGEVRPSSVGGAFEGRVSVKKSHMERNSQKIILLNNKHYISRYDPDKITATIDSITGNARVPACE
jgi:hypothetical protein